MYNDQLVYKLVIWVFFGICLWKDMVLLTYNKTYVDWKLQHLLNDQWSFRNDTFHS